MEWVAEEEAEMGGAAVSRARREALPLRLSPPTPLLWDCAVFSLSLRERAAISRAHTQQSTEHLLQLQQSSAL